MISNQLSEWMHFFLFVHKINGKFERVWNGWNISKKRHNT